MSLLAVGRVYRIACAAAAEVHEMCPRCRRGAAGVMAAWRQMRNAAPGVDALANCAAPGS
jgi:ribosomal protein S27AE